ncbi:O-antigen ligase family protein [Solilutibacter silvestris]|uniref:O-antigen ligase family protein n=1 Tax=Solilutibacter silvestris TaxID=1645665 RepID=UPI0013FDBEB4|nr:O-antigen ligase family protein [Lysobacter silvestris]
MQPDPAGMHFPLAERGLHWRSPVPVAVADEVQAAAPARRYRNNWPLYLFVFLLPLQNIQTGYIPQFGGGLNFLNVFFALSLLGAFVCGGRLVRRESVNIAVLVYMLYAVVSYLVGSQLVSDGDRINVLKDHLIAVSLVYVVQMSVRDWPQAKKIMIASLLPLPYIAKVTWIQHTSVAKWHYGDALRIKGTFALLGANEFAGFCVTMAVLCFALLIAVRMPRLLRALVALGLSCAVFCILFAYSRTAYVAVAVGLICVLLAWRGRWKLMPLFLVVAIALPAILPESVIERYQSTSVEEGKQDESTRMRMVYWGIAWDSFVAHPVTGTGFNTFARRVNPYHMDTHNLYLRTLAEGGVIGALVLLSLLLALFFLCIKRLRKALPRSWQYGIALGMLGAWSALVVGNVFGDRFTYYPMIGCFWVYVGLLLKSRDLPVANGVRR